jgi:hypothetical protein
MINPSNFVNIGDTDGGGLRTLKNDSAVGAGDGTLLNVTSLQDAFITQQKAIYELRRIYGFYSSDLNLQAYNNLQDNAENGYQMADFMQKFYGATPWFNQLHTPPEGVVANVKMRFTGGFTGLEFSGNIVWGDGGLASTSNLFRINHTGAPNLPKIKDFTDKRWAVPHWTDSGVSTVLLKVVESGPNYYFRLDADIPPGATGAVNIIYLDSLRVATEIDFYTQP